MVGFLAIVAGALGAIHMFLSPSVTRDAGGGAVLVSAFGYLAFLVYALTPKKIAVDLRTDRLAFDEGRAGDFPLAGAELGVWLVPHYGTTQGTVLHLRDGKRAYRVGGNDHRPSPGMHFRAPPANTVEAYMPAADFDRLLLAAWPAYSPTVKIAHFGGPAMAVPSATIRCILVPNRASGKAALMTILPWLGTIVLIGAVAGVVGALNLYETSAGRIVIAVLTGATMLAGIVLTAVRAVRTPQAALALDIDARDLRVSNLQTNAVVTTVPLGSVRATPAIHVYGGRMTFTMCVLVLDVPGIHSLTIGIPDLRFSWCVPVDKRGAPAYVVGGADWLTLVERFGAKQALNTGG